MNFYHYRALLWKNFHLKLSHWLILILEMLLPIGATLIMLWMSKTVRSELKPVEPNVIIREDSRILKLDSTTFDLSMEYCYTPLNPATVQFMKKVESDHKHVLLTPLSDERELEGYLYENGASNKPIIGIIFRNMKPNESTFPDKFEYVLRPTYYVSEETPFTDHVIWTQKMLSAKFVALKTKNRTFEKLPNVNFVLKFSISTKYLVIIAVDVRIFPKVQEHIKWDAAAFFFLIDAIVFVFSIPFIGDILLEKNTGVKELLKITGVKEFTIWVCWFIYAMFAVTISVTIVVGLLETSTMYYSEVKIFQRIPFMLLWSFWILYCCCNVMFCFLIASIFQTNTIAWIIYILLFVGTIIANVYLVPYAPYVVALLPRVAYNMGKHEMVNIESRDTEFSWTVFTHAQYKELGVPLLNSISMLVFDTLLYLLLALYVTNINPGKFGSAKSPFFLFEGLFKKTETIQSPSTSNLRKQIDPKYFEQPPSNLIATIQIVDLHKYFNSLHVVRGVNLTTYKGEITALLGHNGAGKTTTMSILTGLLSPSSGSIYFKNKNVFENMDEFRLHIGLCPQENRTIPYLSVMNHLLLFGQLKGFSNRDVREEAERYLNMMNLLPKKNSKVHQLSGGMQRKLCLSIAMMGKAEVLILDEPTSGLDAESRRSLWDLLLNLRGERTMILTTHYMDEADSLGDRIAIMNHGIIVCYGTSIFLKRTFDTGYELTITKINDNSDAITELILTTLPNASVVVDKKTTIVYKLPLTETPRFAALFQALESAVMRLGIQAMGITATTMEHVFLKAGGATVHDPKSRQAITRFARYERNTGIGLLLQQMKAIFKKKFLFTTRDKTNLFLRVFLTTVVLCVLLRAYQKDEVILADKPIDFSLSEHPGGIILYQEASNIPMSLQKRMEEYVVEEKGVFVKGNGSDLRSTLFDIALENPSGYTLDYVSAINVERDHLEIWFSPFLRYSLPATVNAYYNAILRTTTNGKKYSIEGTSHLATSRTVDASSFGCSTVEVTTGESFIWYMTLAVFTTDFLGYFSPFIAMEQIDGFYHIQIMSRVSPFVYWLSTLLFDFILFFVVMTVRMVLFKFITTLDFIDFHEPFYIYWVILSIYGICGLTMLYCFSFLTNNKDRSFIFFFHLNIIVSMVIFVFHFMWQYSSDEDEEKATGIFAFVFRAVKTFAVLDPTFTFYFVFLNLMKIFHHNKQCSYCIESFKAKCEAELNRTSYLEFPSRKNKYGLSLHIIALVIQTCVVLLLLFLLFSGILGGVFNFIKKIIFGTKSYRTDEGDDDVKREHNAVQKFKPFVSKTKRVSLLADGLRKNYIKWFRNFTAVSNTSFLVERGTCFGLLGVNGAGKTTTFKMLTAELFPTAGDAYIEGSSLGSNKKQYLAAAGYCPQTNCLIEQLTATEMLSLIAAMRGIPSQKQDEFVNKWLSIVGLEEYRNRRCGTYSGGNKRKLCSAMSLIGDPKVVFLDEPTSGVDPVSRRNLYDVMEQSRASGQTVILTSHSMEECETLCDRLTIMVSGVMKCIGTVQHLKRRYAQGFSLLIKISDSSAAKDKVPEIKEIIILSFNPSHTSLKDEHAGLLYFQLADTSFLWSVMFDRMEIIKAHYAGIIEDYVLTDTTLEEVFISFAKSKE